jgi:hypothetical protein
VAVSASSATDAWAVGHTQVNKSGFAPLALHWNGTGWSVSSSAATALAGQIADGVADISPTDAYAIGGGLGSAHSGLVAQWNGSTWTRVTVPPPPQRAELRVHQPRGRDRLGGRPERGLWLVQSARAPERLTAGCAPRPVRCVAPGRGVLSRIC